MNEAEEHFRAKQFQSTFYVDKLYSLRWFGTRLAPVLAKDTTGHSKNCVLQKWSEVTQKNNNLDSVPKVGYNLRGTW